LEDKIAPEESVKMLLERLRAIGFPDYASFQSYAMLSGLDAKNTRERQRRRPAAIPPLLGAVKTLRELSNETETLRKLLGRMTCSLVNMRLIASRIEGANGPISLMAQNYATVLGEARSWVEKFSLDQNGDLNKISNAIRVGVFDYAAATVQRQAIGQFRHDQLPSEAGDKAQEMRMLDRRPRT